MDRRRAEFLFLNVGHFLDHYFVLIFATVAALKLADEWGLSYGALIPYAAPGFVAFGVGAIPAGWLADKWSREGMMVVFFLGIGASSAITTFAGTPLQMGAGLTIIGLFAAIYHPVGLAMVVQGRARTGLPLAVNGVFGNMGVACAALVTGFLIDAVGWRSAFLLPGLLCVAIGAGYGWFVARGRAASFQADASKAPTAVHSATTDRRILLRAFAVVLFTTATGGLIFQSTTFTLPKVFDEGLTGLAGSATAVGWYAFLVFSVAAVAQLVVGYFVDRHSLRRVFAVVAFLQMVFLGLMTQADGPMIVVVAIAFMLAVFGQIPINDVLVGRLARSEWRSRAFGLRYLVTFSVMASAVPLIAWLHLTGGFDAVFATMAVAAAAILSAVFLLPSAKQLAAS